MQIAGKINALDLKDVQRLVRARSYWFKVAIASWYGILLIAAVAWATVAGLIGQTKPNWQALGICWAVIIAIFGWSFYRAKQSQAKTLARLNAALPDRIELTNDGVRMNGPDGANRLLPWAHFKGWREGARIFLLDQVQASQFVILPVAQMSEIERQQLRSILTSQIQLATHNSLERVPA